ncbi:MAG: transglycosylase domain-containing protein [Deltaproteobacteria bacterium]|nr:transglycosylase domain-containing protein [Deltaproteobacteria bacterium]
MTCFGIFGDAGAPTVREASFEERLYYATAATLARHGVRLYCSGIERDGLTVQVGACEIGTKAGLASLQHIEISIGAERTWLPLFSLPAITLSAQKAIVARAHASSTAGTIAQRPEKKPRSRWLGLVPVRVDVLRVIAKELPSEVALSFFGWPLARAPHGTIKGEGRGAVFSLRVAADSGSVDGKILAKVAPDLLAALAGKKSSAEKRRRSISLGADFELTKDMLAAKGAAISDALCVEHPRFGEGSACDLGFRGAARFGVNKERLFVDAARLQLTNTKSEASTIVHAHGSLPLKKDATDDELTFALNVPAQDVQQVLDTIPRVWRTGLFGFELEGSFSAAFQLRFSGDDFAFDPIFRFDHVLVKNAPPGQDPRRLNGAVTWRMPFPYPHTVSLWPDAGYVALSRLPQIMIDAVRISEDAAFYVHDGFDRSEIAKAIADIKDGAGARGASTITQQLAKNLYFDGDRNLTRKIEEAIVTAALEASVPKWRLLEIYMNVIEWGDGIFGVERAAQRYFKKSAVALGPKEAAFLAGIIPAPRKVDRELKKDGASAWADKRALRVTKFLCDLGKLDAPTCEEAALAAEVASY